MPWARASHHPAFHYDMGKGLCPPFLRQVTRRSDVAGVTQVHPGFAKFLQEKCSQEGCYFAKGYEHLGGGLVPMLLMSQLQIAKHAKPTYHLGF